MSQKFADIPQNQPPRCLTPYPPPFSSSLTQQTHFLRNGNSINCVNDCESEANTTSALSSLNQPAATQCPPPPATASINTPAVDDFLNESFFEVDFPLFGGDNRNSNHVTGSSSSSSSTTTANDSFADGADVNSFGLPSAATFNSTAATTTTTESAFTYLDEDHSYLLTSLDEFLSNPDNIYTGSNIFTPSLDDYLTSPVDSLMSSHQLTPLASPEPAIATSANTSPLMLNNRPTPPLDSTSSTRQFFPTPTGSSSASPAIAPANPLKRKSPSISTDVGSPRVKDLPPIQITETDDERDIKRKRNTAAARRYRKKKQDKMEQLEEEIEQLKEEKEQIKEEAMKWKMEAEKYQALVEFLQQSRKAGA